VAPKQYPSVGLPQSLTGHVVDFACLVSKVSEALDKSRNESIATLHTPHGVERISDEGQEIWSIKAQFIIIEKLIFIQIKRTNQFIN
jgi:hypothetical protein